jgi:hypothetical protein
MPPVDPSGYWWPPTYSNWILLSVLVQHILLYFFVIVGSTLPGRYEIIHIFQVDTGGLPSNLTFLFCIFSCQDILVYFQGRFGALNNGFLSPHSQNVDIVIV